MQAQFELGAHELINIDYFTANYLCEPGRYLFVIWFFIGVVMALVVVLTLIAGVRWLMSQGPGATKDQQPDYRDRGDGLIERHPEHIG